MNNPFQENSGTALAALGMLDERQGPMSELVEELANINSGTFNVAGIDQVRARLEQEFAVLKGEMRRVPAKSVTRIDQAGNPIATELADSLHISKYPDADVRVALCIHLDTVYGVDHAFQQCRRNSEGHLNGPGVADAKGGIVVMLEALKALESSPFAGQIGWEVLLNSDEEIGSPGSLGLIREVAQRTQLGLLFEPRLPDGTLVSWRKGSGNFTFVVRGKAAHAGREFHAGRNAIASLAKLLTEIHELNRADADVTYNVGRVSGGGALNVVPDLAIGRVNVRVKSPRQQAEVESTFDEMVQRYAAEEGFQAELHGGFSSPPKPESDDSQKIANRIENCGSLLGTAIRWRGTGGACDGNKFAAEGVPNIDTLGPRGGNIHSDQEYLILDSLVPAAKLTALTLMSYCGVRL